jgi:hypothetical protein
MAGTVECRAQRTIADLADPAGVVDLGGLMLLPRPGQSRDRDSENIRFVRPEALIDQVRRP